ncbi:MAG: FmdB family zinc ribbon protein [Nitrospirota bacterium]
MIYECVCTDCGKMVEISTTVSEYEKGLKVTCPECGSKKMARVFSGFAIASKGGGMNFSGCGPSAGPGCCR